MPRVEVKIGPQEHAMEVEKGENLLLEAVSRSVMIPFNCTSGRCGSCRVRVLEGADRLNPVGEREMLRLGEEQVEADYRLACQVYVEGDVRVEVSQPRLY